MSFSVTGFGEKNVVHNGSTLGFLITKWGVHFKLSKLKSPPFHDQNGECIRFFFQELVTLRRERGPAAGDGGGHQG